MHETVDEAVAAWDQIGHYENRPGGCTASGQLGGSVQR
jgi:hypothetical protein